MSSLRWSDDELLRALGAALKELAAIPRDVISAAKAVFTAER
jgi:hypothetical protein